MRIAHISDIHLNDESMDDFNNFIMKALLKDLKEQHNQKKIELILFTGDLIDQGGRSFHNDIELAFYSFEEYFVNPILSELGLEKDRFLFVPGNHDIQRDLDNEYTESGLTNKLISTVLVNDFIRNNEDIGRERIKPYKKFEREFYQKFSGEYRITDFESNYIFNINDLRIGVSCLNSSWRCYGEEDKNRIILGEKQLTRSIDFLDECDIKIALMHHPLDWLANFEIKDIESIITKEYDMLLGGHVHEGSAWNKTNFFGDLFFSIAPANWTSSIRDKNFDYANGYSIIDYKKNCREIVTNHRTYVHAQKCYNINIYLGKNNGCTIFKLPDDEEVSKENKAREIISNLKNGYMPDINEHLLSYNTDTQAPKNIDEVFVLPKIVSNIRSKEDDQEEILNIRDFCNSDKNILVEGGKEAGKTILLDKIMIEFINNYEEYKFLPVFFDFEDITNRIETLVSRFLSIAIVGISEFINKYKIILLIDNLSFADGKKGKLNVLNNFMKEFKNVKAIITSNGNIIGKNLIEIKNYSEIANFKTVQINEFRTKEIRLLIKNWFSKNEQYDPEKLEKVVSIFTSLNIPRTPLAISMFLWIIEQQENYRPINNAVMLENFIERLLKKHSGSEIYSEKFDFKNKERLLAAIAHKMYESNQNNYRLSKFELTEFIREYLRSRKFLSLFDEEVLLNDFIISGVLVLEAESGEKYISFRFNCFIKYFLMKYLNYNEKFKQYVLDSNNYLLFEDEIDYYTGINRDETEILELVVNRMNDAFADLKLRLEESSEGLDSFFETKYSMASQIEEKQISLMGGNKPTQEELDHMNDHMLDNKQENGVLKKEQEITSFDKLFRAWSLAAKVLRNTEETPIEDLKNDSFNQILFCSMAFAALYKFLLQDYLEKNKDEQELDFDKDNYEKLNNLSRFMPLIHQSVFFSFIGTKKLSVVIKEVIEQKISDDSISDFEKYILVFLYADLKEEDYLENVTKLVKGIKHNYIHDMILFKVTSYYYLRSNSKETDYIYENLIGEVITKSKGKANADKNKIIKHYKNKKLLKNFESSKQTEA